MGGLLALPPVAGATSTPKSATLPTVTVAFDVASAGEAPFYAASLHGFFRKFGINVQDVLVTNTTVGAAALESGSVDLAGATDPLVLTQKTGIQFVGVVGTNFQAAYFQVVCNNQIAKPTKGETGKQKLQELLGKKIAFSGIGSTPYISLQEALAFNGMNISQVQVVSLATGTPQYAALETSQVACVIGNPNVVATQVGGSWGGFKLLGFADAGVSSPSFLKYVNPIEATATWVKTHKHEATAFARGYSAAVLWMQKPKNLAGAEAAVEAAEGSAVATGPALPVLMKDLLPALTPIWGPTTVRAVYNADLDNGVITRIPNFNPNVFCGPGSPPSEAAAVTLAAGGPAQKY